MRRSVLTLILVSCLGCGEGDAPAAADGQVSRTVSHADGPIVSSTQRAQDDLPDPSETLPPPDEATRSEAERGAIASGPASLQTRIAATDRALAWLARHQSPDGSWGGKSFLEQCPGPSCGGAGEETFNPGLTGLALLSFLANGETATAGPHAESVKRGLAHLIKIQDAEGCLGPRTSTQFQYNHAFGALALVEAFRRSGAEELRRPAQRAVDFTIGSQNQYLAWRYGVRDGDNDTSITGCQVAVLREAQRAGLKVGDPWQGAANWVAKMTSPSTGRIGYQQRGGPVARLESRAVTADWSEALTAVGITVRLACAEHAKLDAKSDELNQMGAALLVRRRPLWDAPSGKIDLYYWYWASLALHELGGEPWTKWSADLDTALLLGQRTQEGRDDLGSWDPDCAWGELGGRVYATAMACLALQTSWRQSVEKEAR